MAPPQRLARINADVRFTDGLDTRTHQKLVLRGKWLTLQNETLTADGTPRRRDSWSTLATFGSALNGLTLYNSELDCVSGQNFYSFANANSTLYARNGLYANVGVSKLELRRATGLQDSVDMATSASTTCYVWMDYDGAHTKIGAKCSVLDEVTGARILDNVVLRSSAGVMSPRVVRVPSAFLIFYIDGTSLYCRVIQDSAPSTLGAETALVTNASLVDTNFDACSLGPIGSAAVVAYGWGDGTTSVQAISVTQTAGVPSIANGPTACITNAHLPFGNLTAICCAAYDSAHIGVLALGGTNTGLWEAVLNASMTVTAGDTKINPSVAAHAGQVHLTAVAVNGGAQLRIFWDEAGSWNTDDFRPIRTQDANNDTSTFFGPGILINTAVFSGTSTHGAGPQGPFIAGKAFANGNQVYLPVAVMENWIGTTAVNNNQQNSLFVLDGGQGGSSATLGTGAILAKALYGTFGIPSITNNPPLVATPCSTPIITAGIFGLATTERSILSFSNGANVSPTGLCRLTFTPNTGNTPIACQLGQQSFLAGGALSSYDGSGIFDHGFALFPEGIEATRVPGGGAITTGTHQFCAIYEWTDSAGQRHQSAPSPAMSVTTFVNNADSATVLVPSLLLTNKPGVNFVIYMTLANGLVFYRVTSFAAAPPANNQAASFTTVTVTSSDAQLAGNELLYSQPNIAGTTFPNNSPPPCSTCWTHQNRVWIDAADDPFSYRYSQAGVQWLGLQFNETLAGRLPPESGGLVAGVSMDDQNILLCAQRLYRIVGIGPNADGSSNGYSQPIEIPTDCGCADARSVLLTPAGVIFKTAKGWHILGRDLSVAYIGEGVEAFNGNSVSGAVLLKDRKEARFSSSTGTTLVYSYHYKQWSTFTNYAALASIWWPVMSEYIHTTSGGTINVDSSGGSSARDGGSSVIVTTKQTSWIRLKDLNGFQRVFRAFFTGTYGAGAADSQLVINVDFDDGLGGVTPGSYTITIPSTAALSRGAGTAFDFRHVMQKRKCKSVAFQFIDTPTFGGSFGISLQGMTLELGFLRGTLRLPATQST